MEFHPIANLFPLLEGDDFDALVADVKAHGLEHPIVRHQGKILDGRNRWRACRAAGVQPRFADFAGTDALAYVVSANLRRRHLSESQRAMIAARIANMGEGRPPKDTASIEAVSQTQAATLLNVARPSVQRAALVQRSGIPELVVAVDADVISVSAAAEVAALPVEDQPAIVAEVKLGRKPREAIAAAAPPAPEGPGAREKARNAPEVRWHSFVHDLYKLANSVRDCGGIKALAQRWTPEGRVRQGAAFRELAEQLVQMAVSLEEM